MNYVELSGKTYPVAFGYGALMEYEAQTGKNATELLLSASNSVTDIITLIACGLTNGADAAGEPEHFTAKRVAAMIDATPNSPAVIQKIMEVLAASFATEDAKKKEVPMHPNRAARRKAG